MVRVILVQYQPVPEDQLRLVVLEFQVDQRVRESQNYPESPRPQVDQKVLVDQGSQPVPRALLVQVDQSFLVTQQTLHHLVVLGIQLIQLFLADQVLLRYQGYQLGQRALDHL